jgi:hypothetical protein
MGRQPKLWARVGAWKLRENQCRTGAEKSSNAGAGPVLTVMSPLLAKPSS